MNRLAKWFYLMWSLEGICYIPSADFIISEMAKRCITRGTASFNAAISEEVVNFPSLTLSDKGLASSKERLPLYLLDQLLGCNGPSSPDRLKSYLAKLEIDTTVVAHGLIDFEPVLIIGAKNSDEGTPKIFVSKDFVPLGEVRDNLIINYEKWTSVDALDNQLFPRIITIKSPGVFKTIALSEKLPNEER